MKNIEMKARCADLGRIREVSRSLGAMHRGSMHQVDTYFGVPVGRLKLREIESSGGEAHGGDSVRAELIFYQRANEEGPRSSDYEVAPVGEPARMHAALASALGIWVRVEKKRELWLLDNVRIHLDEVNGLGTFVELEAVVDEAHPEESCHTAVRRMLEAFGVVDADLVRHSYSDLLSGTGRGVSPSS
jgi:adenylate cyclase, class 2